MKQIFVLLLGVASFSLFATAQVKERIEYRGEDYRIAVFSHNLIREHCPLESYMPESALIICLNPRIEYSSTGCWRQYVGDWRIESDRLFLICLNQFGGEKKKEVFPLSAVNQNWSSPVLAEWYSGTFLLCKYFEYCFSDIPVYKVEVRNGIVWKVVKSAHPLCEVVAVWPEITRRLALAEKSPSKPFFVATDDVFYSLFRKMKYSALINFTFARQKQTWALELLNPLEELTGEMDFSVLRVYLLKNKKECQSERDIALDFIFQQKRGSDRDDAVLKTVMVRGL